MIATVTPATSTLFTTTTVVRTTTGTTTSTRTETVTSAPEPSKRWLQRHEVIEVLMGRAAATNAPVTAAAAQATAVPDYASPCASSSAYASACSCLGVTAATVTEPTPVTTELVRVVVQTTTAGSPVASHHGFSSLFQKNATDARYGNDTALYTLNATSTGASLSSSSVGVSSSSLSEPLESALSSSASSDGDKFNLKRPTATSSVEVEGKEEETPTSAAAIEPSVTASNSIPSFGNGTNSGVVSFANTTTTGPVRFANSSTSRGTFTTTSEILSAPITTSVATGLMSNATSAAPHFSNSTSPATTLLLNATSSAPPFLNSTSLPLTNATASSSTAPFLNTTTSSTIAANTSTPMPTPTIDRTCDTSSSSSDTRGAFRLRVSQPSGGMFDGWYLKMSGDAIIFTPPPSPSPSSSSYSSTANNNNNGTLFNVIPSSGHLCAVGYTGTKGNAVIGIAQNITTTSSSSFSSSTTNTTIPGQEEGSAVYFIDAGVLADIGDQGYAALVCGTPGDGTGDGEEGDTELGCREGRKEFWVGCGIGLDISSAGEDGGTAVVDGWECTGIGLVAVYS
ncbi:hypothetical protein F4778DRAFT_371100 [Xylariomycetidae sp. FL2044]|nr:hypothetical protein F4778DRAFT_371100 [Xylariomycetidae sp. FL2044]